MAKHSNIKLNKALGQHFLNDTYILQKIADAIDVNIPANENIVEVGPGAGALTKYLYNKENFKLIEYDTRWANYLVNKFPNLKDAIYNVDFLKLDLHSIYSSMNIVGNFPYNISSQIMFRVLDYKESIPVVLGMFQKEVAQRICSKPSTKAYGVLSVLLQAYYDAEYLFDVPKESFNPPPKVTSGVLVLKRKNDLTIDCNPKFFKQIVKLAFQQRRKTLRNSLKQFIKKDEIKRLEVFNKRPEALNVQEFIELAKLLEV